MGKILIMIKIITATIGIPAHNEAGNIEILLNSILTQKLSSNYRLNHIVVACDGCTDQTASIVRHFGKVDQRIVVVEDDKRVGKHGRLNNFYHSVKDDVFVTFDADTRLGNNHVLEDLMKEFEDLSVALVGGNDTPDHPKTLVAKVGNVWVASWYEMRHNLNGGDNVHNHKGCVSASRTSFVKSLNIPENLHSDDDFLYFSCKLAGHKFKFAESAIVYYKIPTTFHEYMTQTTRFLSLKNRIADHFGDWVYGEYLVPKSAKLRGIVFTFIRHPILLSLAIALQIFQRLAKKYYAENYQGVSWKVIGSSK